MTTRPSDRATTLTTPEALAVLDEWAGSCAECDGEGIRAIAASLCSIPGDFEDCDGCADIRQARAHLAARIAELEANLATVQRAARSGMAAAHAIGTHDLALGRKLQAESKPEVIASEREANSMLTEMLEAAEARATRAEAELAAVRVDAEWSAKMAEFIGPGALAYMWREFNAAREGK